MFPSFVLKFSPLLALTSNECQRLIRHMGVRLCRVKGRPGCGKIHQPAAGLCRVARQDGRMPCRPVLRRSAAALALCAQLSLAACGGGGGSTAGTGSTGSTAPTTPTAQCTLRDRQLWAEAQIRANYLFPDDLPASLDPAPYATVQAYIDALTATARAAGKDRGFTYLTSIAQEDAFYATGQTAALGIRVFYDSANARAFVLDVYESGPAYAAGFRRGAEIIAIGTTSDVLVPVATLFAQGGAAAVSDALGPSTAGVTRTLRFSLPDGERTRTVTKTNFDIPPVSPDFGVQVFTEPAGKVGYVNLRTFISSAETPLRAAFNRFRSEGASRIILDFRYNGGGLVSIAELTGDLLGGNRLPSDVFSYTVFRPSLSANNATRLFTPGSDSAAPTDLAVIATGATASASELVTNAMLPWLQNRLTLVGANSYGKPVGQIAVDRAACDDRLRIIAFATQNASRQGDYYTGLAPYLPSRGGKTCAAADQYQQAIGRNEASVAAAVGAVTGGSCAAIAAAADSLSEQSLGRQPLLAREPTAVQRELPGTF